LRSTVQRIVLKRSDLVLPVDELRQISCKVVLVTLCSIEGIFPRGQAIHGVIGVRGRLVLRVGHGEKIAVGIVGKAGETIDGVLNLRDPIEVIVRELRTFSSPVYDRDEPRDGVIEAQRAIAEWVDCGNQVPNLVIFKRGRVIECIGHTGRLPELVVRNSGRMDQRIDGRE